MEQAIGLGAVDRRVAELEGLEVAAADAADCYVHNAWRERLRETGRSERYRPTRYAPSRNWSQGGEIVERLVRCGMRVDYVVVDGRLRCTCRIGEGPPAVAGSLLEAAMRCYAQTAPDGAGIREADAPRR